jgi:hypothetical protein
VKQVRTEIEIDATPERVWHVLTDYAGWSEWNPLLYRAAGRLGVGERVEIAFQGSGSKEINAQCTVVNLEPQRAWSWTYSIISPLLFRGEHSFAVELIDSGRTRFAHHEVFKGLLVPLVLNEAETKRGFQAMDRALKAQVERAVDGPGAA